MEKELETYLEILNSERCLKKPKESIIILNKITQLFDEEMTQSTIGLLLNLLLNETNALFTFIRKMSFQHENVSAITTAFKLLEHLVTNLTKPTEPYFSFLYQKCLSFLNVKLAKVKEESLKLIRNILNKGQLLDLTKLVSTLEKHLTEEAKIPGTVLEQVYSLLGYLFEKHPEIVTKEKWFLKKMLKTLHVESNAGRNANISAVKGAFEGVNSYLTNYSPLDTETMKRIYEYIKNWSKFWEEKKSASRAGLKILQNHWSLFYKLIYNDKEFWKINMEIWIKEKKEDRDVGFKFLCAFYSVIALFIKQDANGSGVEEYLKEFTDTLDSNTNSHEKKAALVGIKLLVLTGSLTEKDLITTYELVFDFVQREEGKKLLYCLPYSVECISALVLKSPSENRMEMLSFLQNLSIKLITMYPEFELELQNHAVVALEKSFYMLGLSDLEMMDIHIERVLYLGLIQTCSIINQSELELLKETEQNTPTTSSDSYLSLWKYLLTLARSSNLPVGGSFQLKKGIAVEVFDIFVRSFLKIISKLNFHVNEEMELENPSDLQIFMNIVNLYENLVHEVDLLHLQKWLMEILKTAINLSNANPLASGFYKIITASFQVANLLEFNFNSVGFVRIFVEQVLMKVNLFKGDLQMACLKVVLASPVNVIEDFAENTIPALEMAVHLSRNSWELLNDLIETLQRWDSHLPSSCKIMEKILPHFHFLFQNFHFKNNNSIVEWRKSGGRVKNQVGCSDSEFLALQKKFLMFLGNMEMRKGLNIIELPKSEKRVISDKPLTILLPCGSTDVLLDLEEITLRAVSLSESCGDRKTRLVACELLHYLFIVIIGNVNQLAGTYRFLFRKVFSSCLNLGCDSDNAVCQIFEPLMYQVMHYFSGKKALHFSETSDLINILFERLTCPFNQTVRDFAGLLLREFTIWTMKQLTPEELKTTPTGVKRILDKMYSFALHPSYNKRLGAAVLFNKLHSILREEDYILNAYWFELFYYFMESLRMCDGLEDLTEIINAIRHVERPLVENSKQFNEESPYRIVPPDFKGGRLCHLVYWAMERGCDAKPTTRRTAMQLVEVLAPLVEYCDTNMSFVSKQLQNFFNFKEISFESDFNEEECVNWLKYHNAGFEYCTWLLSQNVLTTEEVLQPKFKATLKRFINGMLSLKKSTQFIDIFQRECILSYLHLLYTLRERAILFPSEHWNLLKKIAFKPSCLGFDLNRSSITDQLSEILVPLIIYLSEHLTSYDWVNFYTNLETVVVAPVFKEIVSNQTLSVKNLEFSFTLKVVERSGIWKDFVERVLFIVEESLLLYLIFNSLFFSNGNIIQAAVIDPTRRFYLEELLKIVLKVNSDFSSVINCLENEEEVLVEETGKTVKKGEYFQMIFKTTLLEYLKKNFNSLLSWVKTEGDRKGVKLLFFVLENHSEGLDCLDLFSQWNELKKLNLSDTTMLHLVALGARHVGTPGFLKNSPIADKIYEILKTQNLHELNLTDLKLVFSILPFVSHFAEGGEENKKLSDCLANMHVDVDSLGRLKTTSGKSHYHLALTGFLQSLKTTGSLVLLKFILERSVWFSVVCVKEEIESSLSVFGESRVPRSHVISALELAYQFCFENEKSDTILTVHKLFLTPLMRVAPSEAVQYLIDSKMVSLCDLMTTYWGDGESLMEISLDMMKKICCAGVFQTFVTKVPKEDIDQMTKEKRQSMVMMVRKVFFLLKKPYPPGQLRELHRKLMCEIFNMICCIVSSRCTEEKFYKLFVFDERGSFLFETIDKSFKYDFRMDFDEIPKRKKHVTVLRETLSEENPEVSVKYIQTNTLFSSSLREDVTWFDLTHSFIRPTNPVETTRNLEIELEMDSLNNHECMATLVATVLKLIRDKITSVDDASKLPCWLKFFVSVLKNPRLCQNLQLLVLKAIYNLQQFVVPFCEEILPDLLSSILKVFVNYPINYFLLDLIEMMLEWKHVPQKEKSRLLLTELVEFVMSKSDSIRRDVFKTNLEILKKMVEVWKNGLIGWNLSKFAYNRLSKSIKKDFDSGSDTYLNLHICGVLLCNDISAWMSEIAFFKTIRDAFRENYRNNELLAEVCGLGLKHLEKTNPKNLHFVEQLIQEKISTLKQFWLNILYGIHKHYPRISIPFTFKIFSSAWDSNHSLTVKKLEMLLSHVSESGAEIDETFGRHAGAFLLDMLNSPDIAVQEISLQIAEKLLDKIDTDKLKVFIVEVVRLQRSSSPGVRKWVYEICKKLYSNSSLSEMEDCKIILLRGLSDDVDELVKSCLEFWKEVLKYTSLPETILQIFEKMYSTETEEIFLGNAAKMLVQFANASHSSRILFSHPIATGCKFSNRNITVGSRQSLFLPSNKALTYLPLEYVATVHQQIVHQRPTVNTLRFEPTIPKNTEELISSESQSTTLVPNNPLKRRFYKKESKSTWWKKKPEEIRKNPTELKLYGEYRDGDYPYIQIRNSQILELLEVLCKRDQQTAKLFLISFYSGIFHLLKPEEKNNFLSETRTLFEKILKTSSSFDSCVFSFFLRVILNHKLNVDCQLVSKAAVSSNCISLGALVIEEVISDRECEDESPAKKRNNCESVEERRWLELARLYRNLKEFDASSGIFLDKLKLVGDARKAVWFESIANWQDASKCYESVLRTKPDSCGKEFYTESYLSCLAKLSDWSSLNKCIRTSVNHNKNELWSNYNLLSWFLKSEIMMSLGTDREEFKTILEGFCEDKIQEYILSTHFVEEMCVFDWFSKNLQKANHRIDRLCSDFLTEWSHLDQWSYNLRESKLQKLQLLAELNFAIRNQSEGSRTQLEQNIKSGLKLWEMNLPLPGDDLTIWDVKLTYRREFLKHLENFDLSGIEVRCYLSLAKAALAQENLNMVKECLSKAKDKFPDGDFDLRIERDVCFNVGKMILARMKMENQNVGWDMYLNVWKGISEQISSSMETSSNDSFMYSCNFTLGQLMSDILHFLKQKPLPSDVLKCFCSELMTTKNGLSKALEKKGLEYFEKAKCLIENSENCSPDIKSKTYLELAKFFLKFPNLGGFEKLTKYLLKSMRLGSSEARELFGCVLNFLPPEDHSFEDIIHECESVPSWMFIMWINQILALSNSTLAPFLKTILLRLIEDYPNSIRYALKLRREVEPNSATEYFIEKLYSASPNPIYDDFCSSIRYLVSPQMIMRHYLDIVSREAAAPQPDFSLIRKVLTSLKDLMFSPENSRFRGPVFQLWDDFKQSIEDLIQVNDLKTLQQQLSDILLRVESSKTLPKASQTLESFSPWLYSFHALKSDTELEIPGQYDGTHQPIKKYLVMAMSFRNAILQFDSKCKPIRISILGNDAKNYKFLVKFGEDLRQDERIQQVFQHFNHRLKESYRSRFYIDTYKVVPISLNLGMIQWVEDTVSLYDMLVSSLGNNSDAIAKAQVSHLSFFSNNASPTDAVAVHLAAFEHVTREKAILNFKMRIKEFSDNLLKNSFLRLSTSPEHFLHLRGNFASSHAIMSLTHWLVGIGDRHLQNTLVSVKTGRVLGIDFGYAFGFATQFITPPDLLPFRLTPQIINLMHPLDESGWIKQTMIHCLRIYRKESFRLRSVLEVFVREPVMNWLTQVKSNGTNTWSPREKIELVERKLSGTNPVLIFEADLNAGHSESKLLPKYIEVLKGSPEHNIRTKYGEDGLSEEDQVDCLIDLATDYHVLSKTYIGWNPWL